mmetsp:Transcript_19829/g.28074  ORF Transcript_19829/g.28074 Transcript_19829/m.28074 type:complete len:485 (-) Transcript_19829:244-1698(-)
MIALQVLKTRLVSSLTTIPTKSQWLQVMGITFTTTSVTGILATATNFINPMEHFDPPSRTTTTTTTKSTSQQRQKLQKQQQREELKRKRGEEKKQQVEERKAQRLAIKVAKKKQQEEQKLEKHKRLQQAQQKMGKFATQEIAVLVHPTFFLQLTTQKKYGDKVKELIQNLQEAYSVQPYDVKSGSSSNDANSSLSFDGGIPIQWIRKDYVKGGAKDALQALQCKESHRYQHLHRLVIVFEDPSKFIKLLQRPHEDDDYPKLETYLDKVLFQWKLDWDIPSSSTTDTKPSIILLLHQVADEVHRQWNAHAKSKDNRRSSASSGVVTTTAAPVSDAELHDAICFMLVQHQIECLLYDTMEEIIDFITKMTRALSEKPYQQQVTELECIKKIKADNTLAEQDLIAKANDCWVRQLQQLPRMSENFAFNLAQHYATPRQLWNAYQDPNLSEGEKRGLVSSIIQDGRENRKMSDTLYRFMTSSDVKELL